MNWKMFWQIVLLIVVAVLVASAIKFGMFRKGRKPMHRMLERPAPESMQK